MSSKEVERCQADPCKKGSSPEKRNIDELRFHDTYGHGTALGKQGKFAICIGPNSWAVTSRKLKSEELFTVIISKVEKNRKDVRFCIGVTTTPPGDFIDQRDPLPDGNWVMDHDGAACRFSGALYGPVNYIYAKFPVFTQIGFRYSVVRKDNGDLHFFINGRDLGIAAKDVPENIYGHVRLEDGVKSVEFD